jgi:quinoprotein glucose dehydrogenase
MPRLIRPAAAGLVLALAALSFAVPPEAQKEGKRKVPPDAEQALARASLPAGLKAELWAAEPLLANPVAFAFDERGRCFVAETYRLHDGVLDTRGFMHMLDDDIGSRTIADRLRKYERHKYPDFSKFAEQVRVVWDSTGSGHADKSAVFAGGFNGKADGLAAGVLARKGTVYFTCIPDLYALGADPGKPEATSKTSLATGFGVRDQFVGHDLHGLVMGPDGKLYFSVGDRGLNVTTKEGKKLFNPDSGAVLRCDPDGSHLEIVHVGLRNPQELAFDDYGNLFTYDNNSDSGDQARWVQIVEGGDSGWRCGYQYGTLMHHAGVPQGNRGPWNTEKIWHVPGPDGGPPAYVVPPLLHFGNGPSGIVHYPGVGLADRYKGHFFATDFTADARGSKIWSLAVKPKGASFEVVDLHPFISNMVPTDVDFGPDGALYWLDWVGGWNKPGKGRVFRVTDPEAMKNPAVAEAKKLLAEGLEKKSVEELGRLLGHPHRQVRLEAQYELADRTRSLPVAAGVGDALAVAADFARKGTDPVARRHAIWSLGMMYPNRKGVTKVFLELLESAKDADARGQAARTLTLCEIYPAQYPLMARVLSAETDMRTKFLIAEAFGKLVKPGDNGAGYKPLFDLLKTNDDRDAYLRHAAANALARMTEVPCNLLDAFAANKKDYDTPAVRLGVVLALRKLQCRRLGEFLNDADPTVVAEAARAIYDQELMTPMAELAKLADKPGLPDVVAYRAVAANVKLGTPEAAARVARYAARSGEPDHVRAAALTMLADWAKPPRRDRITGLTQNLEPRPAADAVAALKPVLADVFAGSDAVRSQAVKAVAALKIADVGPLMLALVTDTGRPAAVRAEALFALEALKAKELAEATKAALASPEPKLRAAGRVAAAKADPAAAVTELPALLADDKATVIEMQYALDTLAGLKESKEVDAALAVWLDKLIAGTVPTELRLDVLEAAQERANTRGLRLHAPLRELLKQYDQRVRAKAGDNLALRYPEALAGGDAEKGRQIYLTSAAVYCQRCHKVGGQGGEVGPPLDGLGAQKTREYLLESIVVPNAQIAEGYKSVILNLLDGKAVGGVLRAKDQKQYTLVTAENKVLTIPVDDVESERPDKSAMPDDLHKKLSKRELRDVVEFLAGLKEPAKK